MILRGEQLEMGSAAWRLGVRARLALESLSEEVAVGSVDLARVGLITIALGLQTAMLMSPGHFRPAPNWEYAVLVPLLTLASLLACLCAGLPLHRLVSLRVRQGLCVLALLGLGVLTATSIGYVRDGVANVIAEQPYTNDGALMDLYAAQQVLRGHNPYFKTSIVQALAGIDAPAMTVTPLMAGQFRGATTYPSDDAIQQVFMSVQRHQPRSIPPEFESKYNYPAGSFLFILPFAWAGVHDMRFLYALAILGMAWYLFARMPRALRPLVPLIVLGNVPLIALTAGGQPDPIYGLLLLVGYAEWRRRWASSVPMGLALATKQLSWFFLPFYLVLVARQCGWREAVKRTAVMGGVFLLLNGPFIAQSPSSYFSSIAGPMSDPMFPLGVGIIAIFVGNVAPMVSKLAFTLAEVSVWAASAIAYLRWRALVPVTGVVLGALPLFFAWRSLVNYFYLVPLFAVALIFANAPQRADA
jgi:hypothetical protein